MATTNIVIPESVTESTSKTLKNLDVMERNLHNFLPLLETDSLTELPAPTRAHVFLLLAKAISSLYTVKLRCSGINPDEHPVKSELERLRLYEEKMERHTKLSKAPLRPSTTLNYQAATRFIEHSLSDLTPEQRDSMRTISRKEGYIGGFTKNHGSHKKRKCQQSGNKSVRAAAQEFLEKATKELLGSNCEMKGPLRYESSDKE